MSERINKKKQKDTGLPRDPVKTHGQDKTAEGPMAGTGLKTQGDFSKSFEGEDLSLAREQVLQRTALSAYQIDCLKNIPLKTVRQAWFTVSHLLLEPGAIIAVMGCQDGSFPYAMAILNPDFHIIGIDNKREIVRNAKKMWQLTNLEFVVSKINRPSFPNSFLDAVVDSFTLHEVYSDQGFSDARVREMLENHFILLKQNGLLFLRDFAQPSPEEYVLIELPDIPSKGLAAFELSEKDLLLRFAEEARASEVEGRGFFLEELPPYKEKTRLFRLPFKWAYEFILRKDNRLDWEKELSKEYTFMTPRELRKTLRGIGARVVYTAPHWDETKMRSDYEGHFQLYDDDGQPLGFPPTSHVFVAQKIGEGQSLRLEERRPSYEPVKNISIKAMRNTITGGIVEVVSRDSEYVEFMPYRITDAGRLHIFLHEGVPKAITNAVPRKGRNLDGKRWSGHMVETISIDRQVLAEYEAPWNEHNTKDFTIHNLGLCPQEKAVMEPGPEFYPNPKMIEERIETCFLPVLKPGRSLTPKWSTQITHSFLEEGNIKEFDAQHILNAINVGLIPNSRLEMQIMALFLKLGIRAESWANTPLQLAEVDVDSTTLPDLMKILSDTKEPFEPSDNLTGQIRTIHSYFANEGYSNGIIKGLTSRDLEFFIPEGETVSKAVVLPLIKDLTGEVLAGYIDEYMPIPQRYGKNSRNIRAPSFDLPPEVKDIESAKAFIGQKFGVTQDRVIQLGESYFMHNTLTPQRIFLFAALPTSAGEKGPGGTFTNYAPIRSLWMLIYFLYEDSFMQTIKMAMERMHKDIDFGIDKNIGWDMGQEAKHWPAMPSWGEPIHMNGSPFMSPKTSSNNLESSTSGDSSKGSSGSSESGGFVSHQRESNEPVNKNTQEIRSQGHLSRFFKPPFENTSEPAEEGTHKGQKRSTSTKKTLQEKPEPSDPELNSDAVTHEQQDLETFSGHEESEKQDLDSPWPDKN